MENYGWGNPGNEGSYWYVELEKQIHKPIIQSYRAWKPCISARAILNNKKIDRIVLNWWTSFGSQMPTQGTFLKASF